VSKPSRIQGWDMCGMQTSSEVGLRVRLLLLEFAQGNLALARSCSTPVCDRICQSAWVVAGSSSRRYPFFVDRLVVGPLVMMPAAGGRVHSTDSKGNR
jgi:hypothetical protein